MTGKEVRAMRDEEIREELANLRARVYTLRTQSVTEKVENNQEQKFVRRDIARLLGEQHARSRRQEARA